MQRSWTAAGRLCVVACAVLSTAGRGGEAGDQPRTQPRGEVVFREEFATAALPPRVWAITRENDFQESTIDIVQVDDAGGDEDRRLRLRASTIGTDDRTVKFHGVRTATPIVDLREAVEVSFSLDWNNQANGCYLTAGVYLCPTATDANPRNERDWLRVQYIGVPPGRNARCLIASKVNGRLKHLFTEGWPTEQRMGRQIALQNVRLRIDRTSLKVIENGRLLFELAGHRLGFTEAYLYLQMSSHSNYPAREIYFDNICVLFPRDG